MRQQLFAPRSGAAAPRAATPSTAAVAPPAVHAALAEAGQPLAPPLRQDMERRFGHDFARVRVHTGTAAAGSAQALDAQAYTAGSHIVFAPGRFAPALPQGRHLLAHELAHVVQQAGGAAPLVQRQDAKAKAVVPTEAGEDDLAGPADTALRQQLVEGMNAFMDAVVGDPVYESAMKEVTWNEKKGKEALALIARFIAEVRTGKKQPPVAVTTTCIAVQQAMVNRLQGIELRLGTFERALGPNAKLVGEALGPDVWHEARPGMAERPKRGDIYVLEFQNEKVVQLVQYLAGMLLEEERIGHKSGKLQDERAALQQQIRDYDAAAGGPKPPAWREGLLDAQIAKLEQQQARLETQFASVAGKLEAARGRAAEQRELSASHPVRKKKKLPDFEFSHVGYVVSIKPKADADPRGGVGRAQETWLTFDGGQRVRRGGGTREGATLVERTYHPETNEITGEGQQRAGARLLKGWLDVDKLVGTPPASAKKAGKP